MAKLAALIPRPASDAVFSAAACSAVRSPICVHNPISFPTLIIAIAAFT